MAKTVYALVASDEPLQVRYIGITTTALQVRLNGHHNDRKRRVWRKDHRKSDWLQSVLDRGAEVQIVELSNHLTDNDMFEAELSWIRFWSSYCDLLNIDVSGRRSGGKRKVCSS